MTRILILPGLFGSAEGHWQRHWLSDQPGSLVVEQGDWGRPGLGDWLARLEGALEQAGEAYLVAHSLGGVLAAHLARRASAARVKGALLVATCDLGPTERLYPGHIRFGSMPTHRLPFPAIMVGSLNDPYMPIDRLTLFSNLWGAELQNIGPAGHINVESGYGRWTKSYALFERLIRKSTHLQKIPPRRNTMPAAI